MAEASGRKHTDVKAIKVTHIQNEIGVEFCVDNLLQQLQSAGYISKVINRYVQRWPKGVGVKCEDTMCFIRLESESEMDLLFHCLDGYYFHNIGYPLKVEWGWFTFTKIYKPLPSECSICSRTLSVHVNNEKE